MHNKRSFFTNTGFLLSIFTLQIILHVDVNGQEIAESPISSVDTLSIYDTVWIYETIYDTVWIFDTIFIDPAIKSIKKLNPVAINQIYYSNFYYNKKTLSPKSLTAKAIYPRKHEIKRSKYYKLRYELKQKRREPKQKKRSSGYDGKLTLNPTKGKFNPQLLSRGIYSFEAYSGPVFQNTQYSYSKNSENIDNIRNSTQNLTGIEYGVRLNYNLFQYTLQAGLGISQLREKFNYINTNYYVDSTELSIPISNIVEWTDTIQFIDIDKLMQGDTVWITHYDTYDTLLIEDSIYYKYDTTITKTPASEINSHYLLEIPIIFSHEWGFSKTAIQLKLGGVNQIHMFSKGKSYSNSGSVEDINQTMNFTRYNFAVYAGIGFIYDISRQISFTFDAFYKYPLLKFSTSYGAILNKQTYGANIAIRYRF